MSVRKPKETAPGLFGYEVPVTKGDGKRIDKRTRWHGDDRVNPMVAAYGRHPDQDLRCRDCDLLYFKQFSSKYFKCIHRGNTASAATDHRKLWPACTKLVPRDESKTHRIHTEF